MSRSAAAALLLAFASACATNADERDLFLDPLRGRDPLAQGWLGVSELQSDEFERDGELPVIGGAFQQPLGGRAANLGFEAGLSFEWEGDLRSVSGGGGGLTVVADNDVLLADLFVGPYGEIVLAERWRFYAASGALLQYGACDAEINDPSTGLTEVEEDALGGGVYARGGLEFVLPSGASLGLGVRWVDAELDFGPEIGSYDLERVQWLFTLTRNI